MDNVLETDKGLLRQTLKAWQSLEIYRQRRRRFKNFAYGRQLSDSFRDSQGRVLTEEQYLMENGRMPITNNLIRQLIKSIIGRYRYISAQGTDETIASAMGEGVMSATESPEISDLDARALEEFLISGSVVQRINNSCEEMMRVENVSPERLFFHRFTDSATDKCRFVGMLHDISPAVLLRRFSQGDMRRYLALKNLYKGREGGVSNMATESQPLDFEEPQVAGCCRVIEVWERLSVEMFRCHDRKDASYSIEPFSEEVQCRLERVNKQRQQRSEPTIDYQLDLVDVWRCSWLAPTGEVLGRHWAEQNATHPFVMKFYPLIDGEVHSLVEDVVDQQKYVNRLISLLDSVIASSAKGVLLYPADQLPEGFTWRDLRRIWSNPNGILPFKRTSKNIVPQQVNSQGASAGASEMLRLQLQLFDEISGTSGAIRGKTTNAAGAEMLQTELEIGTISLLDLLASFRAFVRERNRRLKEIVIKPES